MFRLNIISMDGTGIHWSRLQMMLNIYYFLWCVTMTRRGKAGCYSTDLEDEILRRLIKYKVNVINRQKVGLWVHCKFWVKDNLFHEVQKKMNVRLWALPFVQYFQFMKSILFVHILHFCRRFRMPKIIFSNVVYPGEKYIPITSTAICFLLF